MTKEQYTVPLIDPETGDGWDEEVEAETPQKAIQKATSEHDEDVHVASKFIREHLEIRT